MILQQVLPSNLCSLLRLSNTAAPTAVQLARIILRNAPVDSNTSSQVDRPRCLSLWTVILHDQQDLNCVEVLRLAGGPSALLEALLWARDWATERRSTAQAQARTRLLQQLLALMSCCCRSPIGANSTNECKLPLHQLILLWTGSFGCLLKAATPQQEKVWKKRELESGGAMSAEFLVRGDLPPALHKKGCARCFNEWPMSKLIGHKRFAFCGEYCIREARRERSASFGLRHHTCCRTLRLRLNQLRSMRSSYLA